MANWPIGNRIRCTLMLSCLILTCCIAGYAYNHHYSQLETCARTLLFGLVLGFFLAPKDDN